MHFIERILATGDQFRNDIIVKIKIMSNFYKDIVGGHGEI